MRGQIRLRFVVGVLNVAIFAILGIQQHKSWISNAQRASLPYETFFCTMLERQAIPAAERQDLWWWCCGECRDSGVIRLALIANIGAFVAVLAIVTAAAHVGVHNQVVVFYGSMPVAILLWWYLLGSLVRLVVRRPRSSESS
jgi:hypothetical protein